MEETAQEAADYIQEKQKEIGLALLIVMQSVQATTCNYSIEFIGKGKKYKVITVIEELEDKKENEEI